MVTKSEAIKAITCLMEDMILLQDGSWQPDYDSCECSIDNVQKVMNYLKDTK